MAFESGGLLTSSRFVAEEASIPFALEEQPGAAACSELFLWQDREAEIFGVWLASSPRSHGGTVAATYIDQLTWRNEARGFLSLNLGKLRAFSL